MKDRRSYYCLVSINSSFFDSNLIADFCNWAKNHGEYVRFVILSHPERHNIRVFESVEEEKAQSLAHEHAAAYQQELHLLDADVLPWEELCDRIDFNSAFARVLDYYQGSRAFKAHCLSQTFSNLQPRFRKIGVNKKSDAKVQQSAFYLLEELAVKLGAFESGQFLGEILPRDEMEVVKRIYAGSYFPCTVSPLGFRIVSITKSGVTQIDYAS